MANPDDKRDGPARRGPLSRTNPLQHHSRREGRRRPSTPVPRGAVAAGKIRSQPRKKQHPRPTWRRPRPEPAPTPASSVDQSTPTLLGPPRLTRPRRRPRLSSRTTRERRRRQAGSRDGSARADRGPGPVARAHRRKSPRAGPRRRSACSSRRRAMIKTNRPRLRLQSLRPEPGQRSAQPAAPAGETANAKIKPNEALVPAEPKTVAQTTRCSQIGSRLASPTQPISQSGIRTPAEAGQIENRRSRRHSRRSPAGTAHRIALWELRRVQRLRRHPRADTGSARTRRVEVAGIAQASRSKVPRPDSIAAAAASKRREPAHDAGTDARARPQPPIDSSSRRFPIPDRRLPNPNLRFRHERSRNQGPTTLHATEPEPREARASSKRARRQAARDPGTGERGLGVGPE